MPPEFVHCSHCFGVHIVSELQTVHTSAVRLNCMLEQMSPSLDGSDAV